MLTEIYNMFSRNPGYYSQKVLVKDVGRISLSESRDWIWAKVDIHKEVEQIFCSTFGLILIYPSKGLSFGSKMVESSALNPKFSLTY